MSIKEKIFKNTFLSKNLFWIFLLVIIISLLTFCSKKIVIQPVHVAVDNICFFELKILPKPSASYELTLETFKLEKENITLFDIRNKILASLHCGNYDEVSYYDTNGDGFIMVTRPEKINDDRSSFEGESRWDRTINLNFRDLLTLKILKMLFTGKYGIFRMFAFIISKDRIPMSLLHTPKDEEATYNLFMEGYPTFSKKLASVAFTQDYYITVFIYEFGKYEDTEEVSFNLKGQISGKMHLELSKIANCLGGI